MLEGILKSAGFDKNKHFKAVITTDKGDWTRDVIDVKVQTECMEWVGKKIQAQLTQNLDNKYFHISAIKLAESPKPAPEQGKAAPERASKGEDIYREPDWDSIGLKKARCNIIQSACILFQGNKTVTVDHILAAAKAFEKYVYEPTLADVAKKMADEANELPF
jgi:hypothetical protein